jgi:hypothetical protein
MLKMKKKANQPAPETTLRTYLVQKRNTTSSLTQGGYRQAGGA